VKRTIHLYGRLKDKFGPKYTFDVETAAEGFRALSVTLGNPFLNEIKLGSYRVIRGRRHGGMELDIDLICNMKLGSADLHVIPVPHGARNKGGIKAVIGIAIVGAAIFFSGGTLAAPLAGMGGAVVQGAGVTWGNIAALGLAVSLAGVSQALSKAADDPQEATDQKQSYTFSGPVNVNEQGTAVPLIYGGPIIVGSQAVSAGFDVENRGA
jgi:predicted phage tail protein